MTNVAGLKSFADCMPNIQPKYSEEYLNGIKNEVFTRADEAGNKDGRITSDEVLEDLNIGFLLSGQNGQDTAKILTAAGSIPDVLVQYAGEDGEFSPEEYADFLNGDEWGAVLDAWHSSGKKAELELGWIDRAGIVDGAATKGEMKAGIAKNLIANGIDVDTAKIKELIDYYAGDDGTFSKEEYMELKNDSTYKEFIETHHVSPWFTRVEE